MADSRVQPGPEDCSGTNRAAVAISSIARQTVESLHLETGISRERVTFVEIRTVRAICAEYLDFVRSRRGTSPHDLPGRAD